MSPLLRKEIRLLLPAWIAALVVATMPVWLWREFDGALPVLFGAAVLALALSPFGQETSHGTFGLLLVQPVERRRFLRIKTGLLAVALTSAWALFAWCLFGSAVWMIHKDLADWLKYSALLTLLAFSGGLWCTLLLRDIATSLFCACLVPAALCAVTLATLGHWIDPQSKQFANLLYWVLAAYAVAGVWWARRLFLGAQDVCWAGGQISLTAVRGISLRWLAFEFKGRQNRFVALVKKELQLQEATMVLIPLLALLYLAAMAGRDLAPEKIPAELVFMVIPVIWLAAVPLVIGCVAVAEERRLNTLDSLLCLPTTKREQFAVKFAVALVLGIVLGGIIPWVLEHIGDLKHQDFELRYVALAAAATTAIAFYASTMSRSLLQALPTAVCIPTLVGMAMALGSRFTEYIDLNFLRSSLFPALAWPAIFITFFWLTFDNYKRAQIGWRIWIGNLTGAGAVAGCIAIASIGIFDRCWESILPLEPRHGPARISGAGQSMIGVSEDGLCVLLPDGRLWIGKMGYWPKSISGGFAASSNWVELAANDQKAAAIQSDGKLYWIIDKSTTSRIGSDSDWKKIAGNNPFFHGLKQDGTLWGWGLLPRRTPVAQTNRFGRGSIPNFEVPDPVRIGGDSDWADVCTFQYGGTVGVKRDGSAWRWGEAMLVPDGNGTDAHSIDFESSPWKMQGSNWCSMASSWNLLLGIRGDGSLWAANMRPAGQQTAARKMPSKIFGEDFHPAALRSTFGRVGNKSDWIALSGASQITALEANGALWTMDGDQSKLPSKYTDWLAATQEKQFTWALAKDGTLSCWDEFGITWPVDDSTFFGNFFLGPTRRPVFSVNILDAPQ